MFKQRFFIFDIRRRRDLNDRYERPVIRYSIVHGTSIFSIHHSSRDDIL